MKQNTRGLSGQSSVRLVFAICLVGLVGCNIKPKLQCMDINNVLLGSGGIDEFLQTRCQKLDSSYRNPIYPYNVNYKISDTGVKFANLPLVESWVLKIETSFTFFLMLKDNAASPDLVEVISKYYGSHFMESNVEIGSHFNTGNTFYWRTEKLKIMLERFPNVRTDKKYDNCDMLIIGNMDYLSVFTKKRF
jgi:hypothetical protein